MANKDVSHLIERLEAFEDRVGVSLEGLYASLDTEDDWLTVNGEIHPRGGTELDSDIDMIVTLYDAAGRVLRTENRHVYSNEFFGFEAFSQLFHEASDPPVAKIRVYPKAAS